MKTKHYLFVRFYCTTEKKVNDFIAAIKELFPNIVGHDIKPVTRFINMSLPVGYHAEVSLYVKTRKEYEELFYSEEGKALYMSYTDVDPKDFVPLPLDPEATTPHQYDVTNPISRIMSIIQSGVRGMGSQAPPKLSKEERLRQAVEEENYELAAKIRDEED